MSINSRNKGKGGELEVRDLFRAAFEGIIPDVTVIRRNHQQAEIGGADLVGVPYYSVEVKRMKQISWGKELDSWWEQCTRQAKEEDKIPLLLFRQDHGKWFVMLWGVIALKLSKAKWQRVILQWDEFEKLLKNSLLSL